MTIADRIAVAALATALVAVGLGAWLLLATGAAPSTPDEVLDPFGEPSGSAVAIASDLLVVDVEGAVQRPGIIELPAGSRVADALAAGLGGYSAAAVLPQRRPRSTWPPNCVTASRSWCRSSERRVVRRPGMAGLAAALAAWWT